jgi:predicted nucleic acid-binding protein
MRTAVDSNIFSALVSQEPTSERLVEVLGGLQKAGALVICGTVFAELHAIPRMTPALLQEFLRNTSVAVEPETSLSDWSTTGTAFAQYVARRRQHAGQPKRLLADFAIGSHASRTCDQLFTLDPSRYRHAFPDLTLLGLEEATELQKD